MSLDVRPVRLMPWQGALALCGAVAIAVGFLSYSPRSPLALGLADNLAGQGDLTSAVDRYDAIAAVHDDGAARETALWRAGVLLAMDLHDGSAARSRFRHLTVMEGDSLRAPAYAQVGRILLAEERRPADEKNEYDLSFKVFDRPGA